MLYVAVCGQQFLQILFSPFHVTIGETDSGLFQVGGMDKSRPIQPRHGVVQANTTQYTGLTQRQSAWHGGGRMVQRQVARRQNRIHRPRFHTVQGRSLG